MKKIILTIAVLMLTVSTWAQNKSIDKIFDKYSGKDGFTTVVITKYMFGLFSNIETSEDDEYMNMIKNLNDIRILTAPSKGELGVDLYKEAMSVLPKKEYNVLMEVNDGEQDVKFLVKEEKDKIVELLMIIGGEDESVLMSISGVIDMKTIAKLSKSMNIDGMENLEKIEKKFPR